MHYSLVGTEISRLGQLSFKVANPNHDKPLILLFTAKPVSLWGHWQWLCGPCQGRYCSYYGRGGSKRLGIS